MPEEKRYLGDGVYASFDGYQIWIETEAFGQIHSIALDHNTMTSLHRFATDAFQGKVAITDKPR